MNDGGVLYELDLASGRVQWNEQLYKTYGYDKSEPVNSMEWWADHIHPDDAMLLNQTMDKLMDPSVTEWAVEYRMQKGDKTYVLVRDNATVLRDEDGRAVRLTGSLTPVVTPA
ncbi:MAG TPA: PAS domain-containing protein [Patescibacteria group bacterium]|nr:PAS domain-containing protein [Patescibacteria group bacterium]